MIKKLDSITKISTKKELPKKKAITKAELEQTLLNNFVNLQKVLTNLSLKFEELSDNISKLLQLFEISAKTFAEKYSEEGETENQKDKKILEKIDSLLDQNRTIAKGIMLMEERVRQNAPHTRITKEIEPKFQSMFRSKPLPRY